MPPYVPTQLLFHSHLHFFCYFTQHFTVTGEVSSLIQGNFCIPAEKVAAMKSNLQLVTSSQVGLHLLYMKLDHHSNVKPEKLEL